MRLYTAIRWLMTPQFVLAILLVTAKIASVAVAQDLETWPTPYTANEIRDAWVEGFWLVTRTTTPAGITNSRTEVAEWHSDRSLIVDQAIDEKGEPIGESQSYSVAWEQLRAHATFPKATTVRSRQTRTTPLGELEGWVYSTIEGDTVTEFFFADALPGPPVIYSKTVGGDVVFLAEQVERQTILNSAE